MYRAFSLIEILITTLILVISLYFISPTIFSIQQRFILNSEIEQVISFLYQVQNKARYAKQNYSVSLSYNKDKWCLIALRKEKLSNKNIYCNCLSSSDCQQYSDYFLYFNQFKNTEIKSGNQHLTNIKGYSAHLEEKCFVIQYHGLYEIIQLNHNGLINVTPKNKRTTCRKYL